MTKRQYKLTVMLSDLELRRLTAVVDSQQASISGAVRRFILEAFGQLHPATRKLLDL